MPARGLYCGGFCLQLKAKIGSLKKTKKELLLMMNNVKVFQYPILIREHHLDTFGHVNNATYLEILEEARWEFMQARGFCLQTIHESGKGPIVLECHIKFLKELRLRQSIVIESQTVSYEKKIGILRQDIFNDKQELCCEARLTFGFFNLETRKLILPSSQWLEAIGFTTESE
jgi:thioesterase-3